MWSYIYFSSSSVQMENSSETNLFMSKISKENDLLLGIIYTIFGKCLFKVVIFLQAPYYKG